MAETLNLDQNQIPQIEKQIKVYYFQHHDDFYSTHKRPLIIYQNGKVFNGFVKERINGRNMYYIFNLNVFVKLWKDSKGNILVYMSNVEVIDEFFNGNAEVINTEDLQYDSETRTISCGSKKITLNEFDLIDMLEKIASQLIIPTLTIICTKLT